MTSFTGSDGGWERGVAGAHAGLAMALFQAQAASTTNPLPTTTTGSGAPTHSVACTLETYPDSSGQHCLSRATKLRAQQDQTLPGASVKTPAQCSTGSTSSPPRQSHLWATGS